MTTRRVHNSNFGKPKLDLVGRRFGRLRVISFAGFNNWRQARWNVVCKCGTKKVVLGTSLICNIRRWKSTSCGCARPTKGKTHWHYKHGASRKNSKLYRLWTVYQSVLQRCLNPKNGSYPDYGGRGITVCERWRGPDGFIHFMEDMAPRPKGKSLDRINVNGNYEPSNCRWATDKQQANNRRTSYTLEELAAMEKRLAEEDSSFSAM